MTANKVIGLKYDMSQDEVQSLLPELLEVRASLQARHGHRQGSCNTYCMNVVQTLKATDSFKRLLPFIPSVAVDIPLHARSGTQIVVSGAHLDYLRDDSGLTKEKFGSTLRATLVQYGKWPDPREKITHGAESMTASQALSQKGRLPFLVGFVRDIIEGDELPQLQAPPPPPPAAAAAAAVGAQAPLPSIPPTFTLDMDIVAD